MLNAINARATDISRIINLLALLGLVVVIAGSLDLQFGFGEQPCPLCLVQRSGMIGLAVGPLLNLLWGMRPAHYAISILAAVAGGAGSVRQILLHIADPADPGYGPAVLGFHLYTWAFITFLIGTVGCALLIMWTAPFDAADNGVLRTPSHARALTIGALGVITWVTIDALIIGLAVLPECGLGPCPDNPDPGPAAGDVGGALLMVGVGIVSIVIGYLLDRRFSNRLASLTRGPDTATEDDHG